MHHTANAAGGDPGAVPQDELAAGLELVLVHPHEIGGDPVGDGRRCVRGGDDVAAARVDLVLQHDGDAPRRSREFEIAVEGGDLRDLGGGSRGQDHHVVAGADHTRFDAAAETSIVQIGTDDVVDRHPERRALCLGSDLDRLEELEEVGPVVPRRLVRGIDHVVADEGGHRDEVLFTGRQLRRERLEVRLDRFVGLVAPVDEVHLVDGHDDPRDAQQRGDDGMPTGLDADAVPGVDEEHRQVARARAGRHVAGVLFVPRRVRDDELPLLGREVSVRHVDRDSLFPLGSESVHQQGEVGLASLGSVLLAVALDGRELILVDPLRVVEQSPDERALAVVDAAAGEEAQQSLPLVACEVFVDGVSTGVESGVHGSPGFDGRRRMRRHARRGVRT